MNKGRYTKKNRKKLPSWFFLVVLIAILATVTLGLYLYQVLRSPIVDSTLANQTGESTSASQTEVPVSTNSTPDSTGSAQTQDSSAPETTQEPQATETHPPVVIVQKADAEYEKWLAAAMVVCVSMEYPDFELEGVYFASATSLEDKYSSEGAYIIFSSEGDRIAIHANALEQERTEAGTKDISTEAIGFASYDFVTPESIDLASMEEINLEDLSELIAQSMLISIYAH